MAGSCISIAGKSHWFQMYGNVGLRAGGSSWIQSCLFAWFGFWLVGFGGFV